MIGLHLGIGIKKIFHSRKVSYVKKLTIPRCNLSCMICCCCKVEYYHEFPGAHAIKDLF